MGAGKKGGTGLRWAAITFAAFVLTSTISVCCLVGNSLVVDAAATAAGNNQASVQDSLSGYHAAQEALLLDESGAAVASQSGEEAASSTHQSGTDNGVQGNSGQDSINASGDVSADTLAGTLDEDNLPDYGDEPYVTVNNNEPLFSQADLTRDSFETYEPLDNLGRCGVAFALIGTETMPTEERGSIGEVKPSGWQTVKYDWVDGKYLYNRCHLIGFQLAGENANECNLITGTRYLNIDGMLSFENDIAQYVESTGNHVLYRVTPLYEGNNLVASGVQMEAYSVEDNGVGISFNIYAFNVQPGVEIDYATGNNQADGTMV